MKIPINSLFYEQRLMLKPRRYQLVFQTINTLLPSHKPAAHARNMGNYRPNRGGSAKPRLTHFLCIPLVNAISAPQLSKSLAKFKASIPLTTPPAAAQAAAAGHVFQTPLVPDKAIRPLGTLHLTLGVMSLPDQTRLQEAVAFLDSLDLPCMLREAEVEASQSTIPPAPISEPEPAPLKITLTSLLALPNAKSATILHAHPLDSTSRLYPFCVKLRNKFIDAGFMHRDMVRDSRTGTEQPRPLLLHATICNTIYLGKRQRGGGGGGKNKSVYKFDATGLLERFGAEEAGGTGLPNKAIPRALRDEQGSSQTQNDDGGKGKGKGKEPECTKTGSDPFIWARDIPVDSVCISEMGAKPVSDEVEGVVLGEAYKAVAKRGLLAS